VLSAPELARTVGAIAAVQRRDGMIPWFPGWHADPWNHVEAAMALDVGGRSEAAESAYRWMARAQRPDGAWHQYYEAGRVKEPLLDANVTAYVATGVWHHFLATGDSAFLSRMWPTVERAVGFVLELQAPRGEIIWARRVDGTPEPFALLTTSCSMYLSLRCAIAAAGRLGMQRPDWELAVASLGAVIRDHPEAFQPKDRWAMDWYYPVLAGALTGDAAGTRLAHGRPTFLMEGLGTRCVSDQPWVTAAETCECAMAHQAAGESATAQALFRWVQHLRDDSGNYFTGIVHPQWDQFPSGEQTTYSAAAVVLAADTLYGTGPASGLFRGEDLPTVMTIPPGDPASSGSAGTMGR
jgi:hypothetical protein